MSSIQKLHSIKSLRTAEQIQLLDLIDSLRAKGLSEFITVMGYTHWLVGWLVGWSIGWLVGQSSGWLVNPLVGWSILWLVEEGKGARG